MSGSTKRRFNGQRKFQHSKRSRLPSGARANVANIISVATEHERCRITSESILTILIKELKLCGEGNGVERFLCVHEIEVVTAVMRERDNLKMVLSSNQ